MALKVIVCQLIFLVSFRIVNSVSVICYYTGSSAKNGLVPEILDSRLCTHMNYAYVDIWENGSLKIRDNNLEIEQGLFIRVTDLKEGNANLKILLSVGEDSPSSTSIFTAVAKNSTTRQLFIESAIYFMLQFNFDGLDIRWKYPTFKEREAFVTLIKELKNAFEPRGWLLTAAVAANPTDGYNISEMARRLDHENKKVVQKLICKPPTWKYSFIGSGHYPNGSERLKALFSWSFFSNNPTRYLDIVNVMSYDHDGSWGSYGGQNITASASNWLNAGLPKNKLVIGIELFGQLFTLSSQYQLENHTPIIDPEANSKTVDFSTICSSYQNWTRIWEDKLKNPFMHQENQWMGYNDKDSIRSKAEWIKSQDFFGLMVWTLTGDDVKGQCGEEQILLKEINKAIK